MAKSSSNVPLGAVTDDTSRTVCLTVGTAGHIDHGKTELIKFLTGCETDRLPEEKARGMTIDLGFATCQLPDNRYVGIVDVPGHERFIHNMVAGAAGIDAVLLVIAADDGVMPQTIEHFHIVRLLGVTSGMIAVTKTDLVSPERVQDVMDEARLLVDGSFLEDCPIVPISSKTGEGFEQFYDVFVAMVARTAERDAAGCFRMHIERSFALKGRGTIVSGIPRSGKIATGDLLDLLPAGQQTKVRGMQVYGRDAEEGRAGECVAFNLADVNNREVARGMVLATPGHFAPARFVNARFQFLPEFDKPLRPRTAIRLHIGTSDVRGHMVLPELAPLKPGTESYVQFQLADPIVTAPNDFFVVRLLSPVRTLGGGTVIGSDDAKMRRSRGDWVDRCRAHEQAFRSPDTAVRYVLEESEFALPLEEVAQRSLLNKEAAQQQLDALAAEGVVVAVGAGRYAHTDLCEAVRRDTTKALEGLHDAEPLHIGFPRKTVLPRIKHDRALVDHVIGLMLADGAMRETPQGYQLPARAPALSEGQAALAATIETLYREAGLATPRPDEIPAAANVPPQVAARIMAFLVQTGALVSVTDKILFHRDAVSAAWEAVSAYLAEHGSMESGFCKTLLGTTRKYSIPLLEYWDAQGLTKRVGNTRVLREK